MNYYNLNSICKISSIIVILSMTACTTQQQTGVSNIATQPLKDLNLVKTAIPPILLEVETAPYQVPKDHSCGSISDSIDDLNAVLEPDIDVTVKEVDSNLIDKGKKAAKKLAKAELTNTVNNIIPFRGWVRKITGAERYTKREAEAYAAGIIRRAFLKGLRAAKECE